MTRPAVLIVEPEEERRREVCRGLASEGYEVVPATSGEEGVRFAQGLGPAVIVAPVGLARFGDASILAELTRQASGMDRTLVLLGEHPDDEHELSSEVVFLVARDLDNDELIRRLRLVLIGREIGIATDAALEALVDDLAQKPLLELVRTLHRALLSGRIELEQGSIHFVRGNVIAAQAGRVYGLKAFCRLARRHEGPFRIVLELDSEPPDPSRQIREDLNALINAAIQDSLGQYPDPQSRLKLVEDIQDSDSLPTMQQQVLQAARQGAMLQEALDTFGVTDGDVVQALLELEERGAVQRLEVAAMVRIITDSASDLSIEQARAHAVAVIPAKVRFGQKIYRDRIDIKPRDFYRILEQQVAHPETQPPTAEDVLEVYRRTCQRSDVVALHVSSKTSSLFDLGCQAREVLQEELPERHIEVVDSQQIGMALGLLALFAARMGARGMAADEIAQRMRQMSPRIVTLAVLATLDYLNRGGRVGKVQAFFGDLLGIKPLLSIEEGEVVAIDKVRRRRKALDVMAQQLGQRLDASRPVIVAVSHANSPVQADHLRQIVAQSFNVLELWQSEIGPGIGTHVGPGAFAVTVFQPTDDEMALVAPLE